MPEDLSLLTLPEVKLLLDQGGAGVPTRASSSATTPLDDARLSAYIEAARLSIEELTGPLRPRELTEVHDGDGDVVMLERPPVLSLVTVLEHRGSGGTDTLAVSIPGVRVDGVQLDPVTGEVRRVGHGGWAKDFYPGHRNIEITYRAGREDPAAIELAKVAAGDLIAHWWTRRRAGSPTNLQPGQPAISSGVGYAVPNFVVQILRPLLRAPSLF